MAKEIISILWDSACVSRLDLCTAWDTLNMTLKFSLSCQQVPCSSVGRASDCTMLRSVVRVQTLARGILSFLFLFWFSHHIFLLADNRSLISSYTKTNIIYNRLDCMHFEIDVMHRTKIAYSYKRVSMG